MSGWQGANVQDRVSDSVAYQETIEAALHRLRSAYTSSLEKVGAWHRADRAHKDLSQLVELGWAARRSLEDKVLGDPWILKPHASTYARQSNVSNDTEEAPPLRSDGHKTAVKQLAYLGLVNYGDLLIAGLGESNKANPLLLDRGVVRGLEKLAPGESCWKHGEGKESNVDSDGDQHMEGTTEHQVEPECTTLHLALVAYLDAVAVDASDPSVWLKLACAARRLSPEKYRPLIRYSLEQAITALPPHDPPMAVAAKAFQEFDNEVLPILPSDGVEYPITDEFTLEIPRYSWSVVGRALLRIGKQGSPNLKFTMSPFLLLPVPVLNVVCSYLSNTGPLESTCRAVSASVLAARTLHNFQRRKSDIVRKAASDAPKTPPPEVASPEPEADLDTAADQSGTKRTSKRVQCQKLTSGKRSLRHSRRNSVEFCLPAAIFGCSRNDSLFQQRLEGPIVECGNENIEAEGIPLKTDPLRWNASNASGKDTRLGPSSLTSFISKCPNDVTPLTALFYFVAHCSRHMADVIESDPGGSLVVGTCLLDCIDLMAKQTIMFDEFHCLWSITPSKIPRGVKFTPDEVFSIDLLHSELRFKRCQNEEVTSATYDSDANFVTSSISVLLRHNAEGQHKIRLLWLASLVHFWLAPQCSDVSEARATETRGLSLIDDTIATLAASGVTLLTPHLVSPRRKGRHWRELSVETLQYFKKEKQASAIVFIAQEKFLQATGGFFCQADGDLSEETQLSLDGIGSSLLERYNTDLAADNSKYDELVDDFVNIFGKVLVSLLESNDAGKKEKSVSNVTEWIDHLFPFRRITKRHQLSGVSMSPSILTILVSCLLTTQTVPFPSLAQLFIRVTCSVSSAILNISLSHTEDDVSDDESVSEYNTRPTSVKLRCLIALLPALIHKVSSLLRLLEASEKDRISKSADFAEMIHVSFNVLASVHSRGPGVSSVATEVLSGLRTFVSLDKTFFDFCKAGEHSSLHQYFKGLMRSIVAQKRVLQDYAEVRPKSRSERNKITRRICEFVSESCCDLALLISSHPCELRDGALQMSELIISVTTSSCSLLPKLCDSLLWFWNVSSSEEKEDVEIQEKGRLSWCLDRYGKERLRIPVACVINATCGSIIGSLIWVHKEGAENTVALADFYDSDASANDWLAAAGDDRRAEELLRILSQAAHCIQLVQKTIDASDSVCFSHATNYQTPSGPLLPLVTLRSLNRLSLHMILGFSQGTYHQVVWDLHVYPVGSRSVGSLVDECLNKAYRCLHGFTLSVSPDKESSSSEVKGFLFYPPEDLHAAIMLYKTIMRVYGQGRKLPPKTAMDSVAIALPKVHENNANTNTLKSFLFASDSRGKIVNELVCVVKQPGNWQPPIDLQEAHSASPITDEATLLRRGLARLVAQGPLPCYQESENIDTIAATTQTENELSTKFEAIIEVLSCGNPCDGEDWFKAAQCLLEKADIVADRIGLSNGFMRCSDFLVPENRKKTHSVELPALLQEQTRRSEALLRNWIPHLGEDLSIYVQHAWSDVDSLIRCVGVARHRIAAESELSSVKKKAVQVMCSTSNIADFASWQRAWGGVFVSSLRIVAYRCLMLSLYSLKVDEKSSGTQLFSEIIESIGAFYYRQITCSQVYGFPMQPMLPSDKRTLAAASLTCFQKSVDMLTSNECTIDKNMAWDLYFMCGKCNEKIASTFVAESYTKDASTTRKYEDYMKEALDNYAEAYSLAIKAEKDGDLVVDQGGSSHGAAEAKYRLHASRLKCLIVAASANEEQRSQAESEVLRLTESYWFQKPEGSEVGSISNRGRLWKVLVDVVEALSRLRLENGFFHRSVYRHAQALLWAPALYDPYRCDQQGSLSHIPIDWVSKVRGLDCATTSRESALVVMRSLFVKKRPQLVAAWFVEGADTVIQQINASLRKYDSLRGKYISAYIDCLTLCREEAEVDTFLRYTNSTTRDLPSRFQAHAELQKTEGASCDCLLPNKNLSSRFFLVSVKRRTNGALAGMLVKDVSELEGKTKDTEVYREKLKVAYSCFLRIRCDAEAFAKWLSCPYNRDPSTLAVANAVTATYNLFANEENKVISDVLDWSGENQLANQLLFCLQKCASLFPSLNQNYSFSKPKASSKQAKTKRTVEPEKRSFEVAIPNGLKEGDTFLTTVTIENVQKTVRLTVPLNPAVTIRFTLDSKSNEVNEPPKKAAKTA